MLRSVRKTHRGEDVLAIQQGLNQRLDNLVPPIPGLKRRDDGLFVGEDGKFGNETETVVKAFQRRMKLTDDGVVGFDTRKALFPLGLATVNIFMLRMPQFRVPGLGQPGGLGLPLPPLQLNVAALLPPLAAAGLVAVRIPGFPGSIMGPPTLDLRGSLPLLGIPSLPGGAPLPSPFPPGQVIPRPTLVFDRMELVPGGQSNFNFFRPGSKQPREDALTLTLQFIYRRGPETSAHQELIGGVNMGVPLNAKDPDDRPVNFTPFVQFMDVDRLGSLGLFHFWQPYGQLGMQFTAGAKVNPTLTLSGFPVNLGFDLGKHLTINFAGGFLGSLNVDNGQLAAGLGLSFGISAKSSALQSLFVIPPL